MSIGDVPLPPYVFQATRGDKWNGTVTYADGEYFKSASDYLGLYSLDAGLWVGFELYAPSAMPPWADFLAKWLDAYPGDESGWGYDADSGSYVMGLDVAHPETSALFEFPVAERFYVIWHRDWVAAINKDGDVIAYVDGWGWDRSGTETSLNDLYLNLQDADDENMLENGWGDALGQGCYIGCIFNNETVLYEPSADSLSSWDYSLADWPNPLVTLDVPFPVADPHVLVGSTTVSVDGSAWTKRTNNTSSWTKRS